MPVSGLSPDTYLLTASASSDGFSAVIGPVAPKSHSQMVDTETSISAGFSISGSCRNSISGRNSTSGIPAEQPALPVVCDLSTMEVVGSKRLTSPEWVTTGVGPDTRVASAKADSHGRVLRPWEVTGAVSVILLDILALHKQMETATSTATISGRVSNLLEHLLERQLSNKSIN